jgi:hypothetical protein
MAYGTINADLMTTSDGVSSSGLYGFKNRLINGAQVIDQRNAGATVTPTTSQFITDRWLAGGTQSSKFSIQQNAGSVTPPAGFTNYLGVTSLSAYSVGSTDAFYVNQKIEGYNVADLNWGSANAKTITFSFWVRSSLTGTFSGSIYNSAADRSYPYTYTISSANTWEQKTITIVGDTTGTWLTTNGNGMTVLFSLGYGSTYQGTANAWQAGFYGSATGATSVVGTNGATFYITGVQLEKGSTATSFDYRPYGIELQLCQRYYVKFYPGAYGPLGIGVAVSTTQVSTIIQLPVLFRTKPTSITLAGEAFNTTSGSPTGISYDQATVFAIMPYVNGTGFTSGNVVSIRGGGAGTTTLSIDGGEL